LILILLGNNPIIYVLLFVALGAAVHRGNRSPLSISSVPVIMVFGIASIFLLGYVVFKAYGVYAGQYLFRDSLTRDNLGERFQLQAQAIGADPTESVYQRSYISTGVAIASVLATKQDLTDTEKQEIVNILSQSFNNVRYITESFEPINVANWSLRGDLYASVMDLTDNADQMAVSAYTNAIQLEGTNPNLWINLGSVYYRRKVYGEAINSFLKAVQLKPDFANARYNLAYALRDAGYLVDAATQMEVAVRLVPEGTPDHEKAVKDLEEFKKAADAAVAQQQAAAAAQQSPEGVSDVNNEPASPSTSTGPLVAPEDQPEPQVESGDADVQAGVEEIVSEDVDSEGFTPAPADGTEVPDGGKEAPITNPGE
jgi:tetratricopeptide (TPR) repeat protein